MSEMIERMACKMYEMRPGRIWRDKDCCETQVWHFLTMAKEIIEVMREPTMRMKIAGAAKGEWAEGMPQSDTKERQWRISQAQGVYVEMIDEALK